MIGWIANALGAGGLIKGAKGIANIVDKFVETDEEKKAAKIVLMKLMQKPDEVQAEINKIEAGHRSLFVAGARPFLLWVCGFGFALTFLVNPMLEWITGSPGCQIPIDVMLELTLAILGLSGLRTYEKLKGLTK
jgi:hypothetical protein